MYYTDEELMQKFIDQEPVIHFGVPVVIDYVSRHNELGVLYRFSSNYVPHVGQCSNTGFTKIDSEIIFKELKAEVFKQLGTLERHPVLIDKMIYPRGCGKTKAVGYLKEYLDKFGVETLTVGYRHSLGSHDTSFHRYYEGLATFHKGHVYYKPYVLILDDCVNVFNIQHIVDTLSPVCRYGLIILTVGTGQ